MKTNCNSGGSCQCASNTSVVESEVVEFPMASVNGVALHGPDERLEVEALRQRACTELLRQAAQQAGLLSASDLPAVQGADSAESSSAIEALLERELLIPEPDDAACRRHFEAGAARYAQGERIEARHILFAVTPGADVVALRQHAEGVLLELRSHGPGEADGFAAAAKRWSNCPSGAQGGDLGWLESRDCASELSRELFGKAEVGVLPRLVHSRFGLHLVEVLQREAGTEQPFEALRGAIAQTLRQQVFVTALRQYLQALAGQARIEGVDLDAADTPLVQ